jgi:hypothetical protein
MKYVLFSLFLAFPGVAAAQSVTPAFTHGSMQSTSTTEISISRTIATEIYGGDYKKWSGENVTPSSTIESSTNTWSINTAGDPFTLETVTRSAGVVETIDISETIEQTTTTTSLSVFSQ